MILNQHNPNVPNLLLRNEYHFINGKIVPLRHPTAPPLTAGEYDRALLRQRIENEFGVPPEDDVASLTRQFANVRRQKQLLEPNNEFLGIAKSLVDLNSFGALDAQSQNQIAAAADRVRSYPTTIGQEVNVLMQNTQIADVMKMLKARRDAQYRAAGLTVPDDAQDVYEKILLQYSNLSRQIADRTNDQQRMALQQQQVDLARQIQGQLLALNAISAEMRARIGTAVRHLETISNTNMDMSDNLSTISQQLSGSEVLTVDITNEILDAINALGNRATTGDDGDDSGGDGADPAPPTFDMATVFADDDTLARAIGDGADVDVKYNVISRVARGRQQSAHSELVGRILAAGNPVNMFARFKYRGTRSWSAPSLVEITPDVNNAWRIIKPTGGGDPAVFNRNLADTNYQLIKFAADGSETVPLRDIESGGIANDQFVEALIENYTGSIV